MLSNLKQRVFFDAAIDHITERSYVINGKEIKRSMQSERIISTIPMHVLAKATGRKLDEEFKFKRIVTRRGTLRGGDVHQTVYFPSPQLSLYRASIVGSKFIAEGVTNFSAIDWSAIAEAFGIDMFDLRLDPEQHTQRYGKIVPIDDSVRKSFMLDMSLDLGIFSLGRFATWRNILLDDVVDDMHKIQAMQDRYTIMKAGSK
jgi:hypothetical protein